MHTAKVRGVSLIRGKNIYIYHLVIVKQVLCGVRLTVCQHLQPVTHKLLTGGDVHTVSGQETQVDDVMSSPQPAQRIGTRW